MLRVFLPALFAISTFAQSPALTPVATRQVGSATLESVPAIPPEVSQPVQRYQNSRSAVLEDWLPDGSILIATRFGATLQIHRVTGPGADRTQLTFSTEPAESATAIPGTNRFVLSRDTGGDEWFQFYAMGLTGAPTLLTEPRTRNQSEVFSRDGHLMAWARAVKGSGDYAILTGDPADPKSAHVVHQGEGSIFPTDVAPDNASVLLLRNFSNRESKLYRLHLASDTLTEIDPPANPERIERPVFARDGQSVVAISDRGSNFRRLVEIDLASNRRTVLTPDLRWDVDGFALSRDGHTLAYSINEDGYSRVVVLDFLTRNALPQPKLPGGVRTHMKFSPDGTKLAISLSTATSAGDVWVHDVMNGELVRWTNSELGGLDPAALAEPELIHFKSFDDLTIPAFVYRPRAAGTGAKTPVIIEIHGGPESQTRPLWNPAAQYFSDVLGATVILPNVRGSDGYGRAYLELDNAEKREDSVKDIGALLDWISTQPGLDAKRVAVSGGSYGGYMSLASMTHYSDRLLGGIELFGISDFVSFLQNTEAYRRDNRRAEYGDERDPKMRAAFARISPMASIENITKPMLVMQGANDPRVPKSESDQVVARLREKGVPVSYVVFADEGHGFRKKPNNDLRREVETMFLRNLFEGKQSP